MDDWLYFKGAASCNKLLAVATTDGNCHVVHSALAGLKRFATPYTVALAKYGQPHRAYLRWEGLQLLALVANTSEEKIAVGAIVDGWLSHAEAWTRQQAVGARIVLKQSAGRDRLLSIAATDPDAHVMQSALTGLERVGPPYTVALAKFKQGHVAAWRLGGSSHLSGGHGRPAGHMATVARRPPGAGTP